MQRRQELARRAREERREQKRRERKRIEREINGMKAEENLQIKISRNYLVCAKRFPPKDKEFVVSRCPVVDTLPFTPPKAVQHRKLRQRNRKLKSQHLLVCAQAVGIRCVVLCDSK